MHTEPIPFDLTLAREAFATTGHLHGAATRRAADRLTADDFDRLRAHDAAFAAALTEGRIQDAIAADDAFHRVILEVADDPDLVVSVDLMLPRLRRMDLWLFTRKAFSAADNTHPETIAALEDGDVDTAVRLVEESYTHAGEALAAIVERRSR
ncbi:MAG TPA: FCD domain-containing protein [Baekduia sp.]|nr:FCD domain-containing protein [Baekduia sp.]